jgi:hypothetical protein
MPTREARHNTEADYEANREDNYKANNKKGGKNLILLTIKNQIHTEKLKKRNYPKKLSRPNLQGAS